MTVTAYVNDIRMIFPDSEILVGGLAANATFCCIKDKQGCLYLLPMEGTILVEAPYPVIFDHTIHTFKEDQP